MKLKFDKRSGMFYIECCDRDRMNYYRKENCILCDRPLPKNLVITRDLFNKDKNKPTITMT